MTTSQVRKKQEDEEKEAMSKIEKLYDAAKTCLSGPDGVTLMEHLEGVFFIKSTTMRTDANGAVDVFATGSNEGCRGVILYMKQLLEASPKYIEDVKRSNIQNIRAQRTGVGPMGRPSVR